MIFNAILYFLCVYGIATIISSEYIFVGVLNKVEHIPWLYTLLSCNKCLSVWVGFIVSLCGFTVITPIVDAMCAFSVTKLVNYSTDLLEVVTEHFDK